MLAIYQFTNIGFIQLQHKKYRTFKYFAPFKTKFEQKDIAENRETLKSYFKM